jgi:quinol-cytochrome oxidoreductase complex cytochrome b subunit
VFVGLAVAALVLVVILLLSGVWLSFRYEPQGIFLGSNSQAIGRVESHVDLTRTLHRFAAFVLVPVLVGAAIAGVLAAVRSRRVAVGVVGGAVVALGVGTAIGGQRLAWSQIGIPPTETPRALDLHGVWLTDELVRIAVVGTRVVAIDDFRREAWLHVALLPLLVVLAGVGLVLLVGTRRARTRDITG